MKYHFIHLPMKMEPIVSSETMAIRTQTPGNYPKRNNLQAICSFSNEANYVHNNSYYIYVNFSARFGQLCAQHQQNLLYLCENGIFHQCRIDTVSSVDDGHIGA